MSLMHGELVHCWKIKCLNAIDARCKHEDVDGMFHWTQQHSFKFQPSGYIRPKNHKTYSKLKGLSYEQK